MSYTQNSPSFEAIRWVETNQSDFEDFVDNLVGAFNPPITWTILVGAGSPEAEGSLLAWGYQTPVDFGVPVGHWLIYGPMWGGQKEQAQFFVLSNEQFVEQFTAAE
ncbi:hypothetical protein [Lentzea aerocolonigenes]|uniref:hypothetical protein n=1 Tax=Lentzea aerocolonigenes TaxID=68170 RepID=UPI0004C3A561|nr:hypothetical protein [Lentzea aerocolonigenes]MCP2243199.1 hypothetical protein [Lentzea aerocolonigenes]